MVRYFLSSTAKKRVDPSQGDELDERCKSHWDDLCSRVKREGMIGEGKLDLGRISVYSCRIRDGRIFFKGLTE